MSLKEYVRKRKFENTPEPAPTAIEPAERTQGRLFIQRHDATRLHYDLRLEIGGTLKSWAVPKGPSQVPLSKQLAMHVEDHPISYGDFEGNIPKGNYGAGSVMLWDVGTFEILKDGDGEGQLARGDLKFRANGQKMKGEFALVLMKGRGKGNEWLLIKKRDEFADEQYDVEALAYSVKTGRTQEEIAQELPPKTAAPKKKAARKSTCKSKAKAGTRLEDLPGAKAAAMPSNVSVMLASLADGPPEKGDWVYEIKWDGVRAICYIEDGRIRMVSRNGNSFDRQYPELSVIPHHLSATTAILDAEIAALDEQGRSRFGLLQPRIHQTNANEVAHLSRKSPVKLFVFDLLYCDGYDLRGVPLLERKRVLNEIVTPGDRIQVSEHFAVDGHEILEAARQMGLEGVIAKDPKSTYEPKRSRSWLKLKVTGRQEFLICGYTHGERATFSSLVLGVNDEDTLRYVGCVGTGFDDKMLQALYKKLKPLETKTNPFGKRIDVLRKVTWVEPRLLCEVKFGEWTQDGRLRAPVFVGLREDKAASEVVQESVPGEPLFPKGRKEVSHVIDGKHLKFTNLDKIWFPNEGYTKRDILSYYDAVAEWIVPHLAGRPLSLKRYPGGIHEEFFFQKDIPETYPKWLRIEPIHSSHRGEPIRFVVADDRATLLFLTNLGCIDQNPWMSRVETLDYPDYILIDLDPMECTFDRILEAMGLVRNVLDEIGLKGYPKTTGGDGMHVFVPVEPRYTYEQARSFAEIVSQVVIGENPDLFTTPRSVAKRRKGRVYFDYLQISSGKTIAGPYVTRAYDGAPVATPLAWDEVKKGLTPKTFTIENAVSRFREVGDLFQPVLTQPQKLEPALKKLAKLIKS
jgi:bifunctional non-homologous end joining protein LigD